MDDQATFLKQLQELLTFGRFDSTYKFALLQALADISVEQRFDPNQALHIQSTEIAEKFIKYYWRQATPFQAGHVLQQSHRDQLFAINQIRNVKRECKLSLLELRRDKERYARLCRTLARRIRDQPLKKLQRIGDRQVEFLYKPTETGYQTISMNPEAHRALSQLYELVTAAIQGKWREHICSVKPNKRSLGPQAEIDGFLFGQDRGLLKRFREPLMNLQKGVCPYCGKGLGARSEVDHFIPWSRYPLDEGCNLVLSHKTCNNAKKDHIPAIMHLTKWVNRLNDCGSDFAEELAAKKLPIGYSKTCSVMDWAYSLAESSRLRLWVHGAEFEDCSSCWRYSLSALRPFKISD